MAVRRSLLSWLMTSSGISLGQAAAHSPMLVQPPKPSWSCCAVMSTTRLHRSGWPWGSSPRWVIFAPRKSEAEPLRLAVDHQRAHAADALATVGVERDRLLAHLVELLVEDVEHLQEAHVLGDPGHLVGVDLALVL